MDKTILRKAVELLKKRNKTECLSLEELRIAVFEKDEKRTDRIKEHLAECRRCRDLVDEERAENPLYHLLLEHRAKGGADEEFWAEIEKALKEK